MNNKAILGTIQYVPDLARGERINIGIVLHCPFKEFLKIEFIQNKNRLKHFDDELNLDFFNLYTSTIKDEFTDSLANKLPLNDFNLLKNLSYNYVNQFQFIFEDVSVGSNLNEDFDILKKFKLHYYLDKSDRLTNKEKFDLLSKKFLDKGIQVKSVRRNEVFGSFKENINFDFKIADSYIKVFEFNEENHKHLVNQIKVWIYNSVALQKQIDMFFIVEDNVNNEITKSLFQNLKESSNKHVFKGFDDLNLIQHIESIRQN